MKGTLIGLGLLCWLISVRVVEGAAKTSHRANVESRAHGSGGQYSVEALALWLLAIAFIIAGLALIRRAMRPEYKHVPPPQATRDWDAYLAPKTPKPRPSSPIRIPGIDTPRSPDHRERVSAEVQFVTRQSVRAHEAAIRGGLLNRELDPAQLALYRQNLEYQLSGPEQQTLSPDELSAYLAAQCEPITMASWQKPDINGYREGDRVKLLEAFQGDSSAYEQGSTGTIVITNTSPSTIRMMRDGSLQEVLMSGGLIMLPGSDLERIAGQATVSYFGNGDVTATYSKGS